MNPWLNYRRLPIGPAAALAALHLRDPQPEALRALPDAEWRQALEFCNRSQVTLALRHRARDFFPGWVRETTDTNLAHNIERLRVVQDAYRNVSQQAGVEIVALKGLTQCPRFGSTPEERPQYDLDLYVPHESIMQAYDALRGAGFEAMEGMERFPTDHLPPLIRKTGWQYRGDVFDPDMPLAIELHFQFWNARIQRLAAPCVDEFWRRRVPRPDLGLCALAPFDALAYAALHLLKHILNGSARPFHVYEIACFLEAHAGASAFWSEWHSLHPPALRRLQAVAFRLAAKWFGCETGAVAEEIEQLPATTRHWFDRFALSPASSCFDCNKDELWLHLSLLESRRDSVAIARRRLFPGRLPAAVDAVYVPDAAMTWRRRARKHARWGAYAASRLARHVVALPRVALSAAHWWWTARRARTI